MQDSKDIPKNLVWMDLEMTGLIPETDLILEVAAILTKFDLNEIARYEAGVKQDEQKMRDIFKTKEWSLARPEYTEQEIQTSLAGKLEVQVEQELLDFITNTFGEEPVYLAGNSIHMDRLFIRKYWPKLHARLHYRMLDVSSFKLWFLGNGNEPFVKKEAHTALSDIQESISELKYYLSNV
jgi:oligoribonuclease